MNTWVKRGLQLAVFSAGIFTLGVGIAAADSGSFGPIGTTDAVLSSPVSLSGNAIGVLGNVSASGAAAAVPPSGDGQAAHQSAPLISVPITVSDNAIAVAGKATSAPTDGPDRQVNANPPVSVPVSVTNNAVAVAGKSSTTSPPVASTPATSAPSDVPALHPTVNAPVSVTNNAVAVAGKSSTTSPPVQSSHQGVGLVNVPVTVSNNAVSALGTASAHPAAVERAATSGSAAISEASPSGTHSLIHAPVTVCGNAVGLLGRTSAGCRVASTPHRGAVLGVPVLVCGNAVGRAAARCDTSADTVAGGVAGISVGQQGPNGGAGPRSVASLITAPVTVCGNGIGVLGAGTASCTPHGSTGSGVVDVPVTVCGNGIGVLGFAGSACASKSSNPANLGSPATPTLPGDPADSGAPAATNQAEPGVQQVRFIRPGSAHNQGDASPVVIPSQQPRAIPVAGLAYTGAAIGGLLTLALLLLLLGFAAAVSGRRRHSLATQ